MTQSGTQSSPGLKLSAEKMFAFRATALTVAALLAYYFALRRFEFNPEEPRATMQMLLSGLAERPFQYRVLIPWIAGLIGKSGAFPTGSPKEAFALTEAVSVFLAFLAFRHYLSQFIKNEIAASIYSFSLYYVLVFNYLLPTDYPRWYPWDIPSILFFTLGLTLIYKRSWALYYAVFAIATLNKETTCFLTMVYLITAVGRDSTRSIAAHCVAQFAIWSGIKLLLYKAYIVNPGPALMEDQLFVNIESLLKPQFYPILLSVFGFMWVPLALFPGLVKDDFLRRSLLVVVPFFIGMLFVGILYELRIYGELIPIILTPAIVVLDRLLTRGAGT